MLQFVVLVSGVEGEEDEDGGCERQDTAGVAVWQYLASRGTSSLHSGQCQCSAASALRITCRGTMQAINICVRLRGSDAPTLPCPFHVCMCYLAAHVTARVVACAEC